MSESTDRAIAMVTEMVHQKRYQRVHGALDDVEHAAVLFESLLDTATADNAVARETMGFLASLAAVFVQSLGDACGQDGLELLQSVALTAEGGPVT